LGSIAVGFVPGVGELYDLYTLYLGRDPLTGELLSESEKLLLIGGLVLAAVTFGVGDEVADIGRTMRRLDNIDWSGAAKVSKGIGHLDSVVEVSKSLKNRALRQLPALDTARGLRSLSDKAGLSRINRRLSGLDQFTGGHRAFGRGDELRRSVSRSSDRGALSRRLDNVSDRCPIGNSFPAGTVVDTEAGSIPIEEIEIGDKVLAEDPETGEQGYFEVAAVTSHPEAEILKVTIDTEADEGDNDPTAETTEVMEVTSEHPIYVEGKGWLHAENLSIGDRLRRADGGWAKVLAIERIELDEPELVYNFTVKGPHTYFVLEVGVLAHNCGNLAAAPSADPRTGRQSGVAGPMRRGRQAGRSQGGPASRPAYPRIRPGSPPRRPPHSRR